MKIAVVLIACLVSAGATAGEIKLKKTDIRVLTPIVQMGESVLVEVDLPTTSPVNAQLGNAEIRFKTPNGIGSFYGYAKAINGRTLQFTLPTNKYMPEGRYSGWLVSQLRTARGNDLDSATVDSSVGFTLSINRSDIRVVTPEVRRGGTIIVEATIHDRNFKEGQVQAGNAELRLDFPRQSKRTDDFYGYSRQVDSNHIRWALEIPANAPTGEYTLSSINQLRTYSETHLLSINLRPLALKVRVLP